MSVSSIRTPKNFVHSTCSIDWSFILISISVSCFLLRALKRINLVLVVFIESLFVFNHLSISFISLYIVSFAIY